MYNGPFKWWVQSVMPLVFDDSLSYYEVVAKLTKYIEGLTGDVQEIEKVLETIEGIEDVTEFTKFLESVQTEIGNLDSLATANKTDLVSAINEAFLTAKVKYTLPPNGIPENDLSQAVKDKLNKSGVDAEYIINNKTLKHSPDNNSLSELGIGTYSVPEGGIPWSTLSEDVRNRIESGGGTSSTTDYTDLNNKPQINGHTLNAGNNIAENLGLGSYSKPALGIPESDLSAEVREKLNTSGGIADSENTFVATRDYEAGELIYIGGTLYKTKYNILTGTNLIPGNNIEVTDISAEIERINNDIYALQSGSGPDSWNLNANIITSGTQTFFQYFNVIGGENYLFIIDPITPKNNGIYYGYVLRVHKRDGAELFNQRVLTSDADRQQRFTFTPADTGECYCTLEPDTSGYESTYRVAVEYTQSQGISELWAQVNKAGQVEPRLAAVEALVEEQQGELDNLDGIPERVNALENDVDKLNNTIDEITEETRNLFSLDGLQIGKNSLGNNAGARAISKAIFVSSNTYTVSCENLPSNLKYELDGYSSDEITDRTAPLTPWITSASTVTTKTPSSYSYIRVLFGSVNNENLTRADFDGLKLQIEIGSTNTAYIPGRIADDVEARERISALEEYVPTINYNKEKVDLFVSTLSRTRNLFDPNSVLLGYATPSSSSATRAVSGRVYIGTGNTFSIKATSIGSNLKYEVDAYSDDTTYAVGYTGWVTDSTPLTRRASYDYVAIRFGTVDNANIQSSDFNGLKLQIEIDGVTEYIPYYVPNDQIAREKAEEAETETPLRLMEYNIGHYCYGTGSSVADIGLPAEQYASKLQGMIEFFGKYQPDILCMCEFWEYLDNAKEHPSDSTLFDWLYPYKYESTMWNAIKSNYQLSNKINQRLTTKSSTYAYKTDFNIGGKLVGGLVVHFPVVNATAADRQEEMYAAIALMANYDRVFICGDFNCGTEEERDALFEIATTAGYTLANGGLFGWKKTYNYVTQVSYLDNILVKGNIKVKDFQVLTSEVSNLCSDHIPIYADLLVY